MKAYASGADMRLVLVAPSRDPLRIRVGQTIRVTATYARMGTRQARNSDYPTVLVREVREAESGALLTDHLWFNGGRIWQRAALVPGHVVRFAARVIEYRTGYWGPNRLRQLESPPRRDFKLTPPTQVEVVGRVDCEFGEAA